jgi:anti-anti-sigma factor
VLPLRGELCIAELPEVRRQIDAALVDGARHLVLDLAEVELVTAAALRVFVATDRRLAALGGTFALRHPRPLARRVLEVTGLEHLLDIVAAA